MAPGAANLARAGRISGDGSQELVDAWLEKKGLWARHLREFPSERERFRKAKNKLALLRGVRRGCAM